MLNVCRQSTLQNTAVCSGIALHNGVQSQLVLRPAPIDAGLVFRRTDVSDRDKVIPVSPTAVSGVKNCTTLSNEAGISVSTIEHLMAALCAAGVDNLYLDINGSELPALDGSAEPFLKLIEQAGIMRQPAARHYIKVRKTIEVGNRDMLARIEPADRLELDVTIDFSDAAIGRQRVQIAPNVRAFRDRLASARTFARRHEVAALQEAGLSMGGSLDNAVLVDGNDVLNPGGLRYDDEFVRHKALDLMGDTYLGGPILGRITTVKSGHRLNNELLRALFADESAWEAVQLPGSSEVVNLMDPDDPALYDDDQPVIAISA